MAREWPFAAAMLNRGLLQGFGQDLRLAARSLVRSPGLLFVGVVSLAVGIGANTAIVSLLDALIHRRPAGVRAADQLVSVFSTRPSGQIAPQSYDILRASTTTLSGLAAQGSIWIWITEGDESAEFNGAAVSDNYFATLGVNAHAGRLLSADDGRRGSEAVAVISYALWQGRFHRDPSILGRSVIMNRLPRRIIGVAAADFAGLYGNDRPDIWVPVVSGVSEPGSLDLVGRLRPGVSPEESQAELASLYASVPEAQRQPRHSVRVNSLRGVHPALRQSVIRTPLLLLAVLGCMLLVTCGNLTGLLMGRGAGRQHEIAVRIALGAARTRIFRHALIESAILSAAGGAAALLAALWIGTLAERYLHYQLGGLRVEISALAILVALALAATCALVAGAAPALQASRTEPFGAIRHDPLRSPRSTRVRGVLVGAQVAVGVALLIGAALLLQSLQALVVDPGFETRQVAQYRLRPSRNGYSRPAAERYYRNLFARLSALPGVEATVIATVPPMRGWGSPMRASTGTGHAAVSTDYTAVGPGFLRALGIPLSRGREFTNADRSGSPAAVIVSRALAAALWNADDVVGRTVLLNDRPYEVIGVAADIHAPRPDEAVPPYLYLAYWQTGEVDARLFVRTAGAAGPRIGEIRKAVVAVDPDVHVGQEMTLADRVALSYEAERMLGNMLTAAAAMALLLAALGVYGVLSYSVSRRTREVGIRIALGAAPGRVIRLIVSQGMAPVLAGEVAGLVLAWVSTRVLGSYLYGITPHDPMTFGTGAILMLGVGVAACYAPARRAARVDPLVSLKAE